MKANVTTAKANRDATAVKGKAKKATPTPTNKATADPAPVANSGVNAAATAYAADPTPANLAALTAATVAAGGNAANGPTGPGTIKPPRPGSKRAKVVTALIAAGATGLTGKAISDVAGNATGNKWTNTDVADAVRLITRQNGYRVTVSGNGKPYERTYAIAEPVADAPATPAATAAPSTK